MKLQALEPLLNKTELLLETCMRLQQENALLRRQQQELLTEKIRSDAICLQVKTKIKSLMEHLNTLEINA